MVVLVVVGQRPPPGLGLQIVVVVVAPVVVVVVCPGMVVLVVVGLVVELVLGVVVVVSPAPRTFTCPYITAG
jgi:hypothetical protein